MMFLILIMKNRTNRNVKVLVIGIRYIEGEVKSTYVFLVTEFYRTPVANRLTFNCHKNFTISQILLGNCISYYINDSAH